MEILGDMMNNESNLVIYMGQGADEEAAKLLSQKVNAPISAEPGEHLTLVLDEDGLTLTGYGLSFRGDFEKMLSRITKGRLPHEMLVHIAKTKEEHPTAIDATAGMGEDSILLAAYGYRVTMYEQNPVVAALLRDAMRRASSHPELAEIISRMNLVEGNSIEHMKELEISPDLIYLDPMFPARKKSGLINKKLQLIQKLEQPCFEEEALLEAALALHPKKIVIKRPLKGTNLANKKPSYTIKGKAIRYDILI